MSYITNSNNIPKIVGVMASLVDIEVQITLKTVYKPLRPWALMCVTQGNTTRYVRKRKGQQNKNTLSNPKACCNLTDWEVSKLSKKSTTWRSTSCVTTIYTMKKIYLICAFALLSISSSWAQNVQDSFEIFFDYNKAVLREDSKKAIDSFLRATTDRRLMTQIIGHTCDIGNYDYNLALSKRRAKAAMEYILKTGEPEDQLELLFFGKAELKYDINTMREKNRRVFFGYTLEDDDRDTLVKAGCLEAFYEKSMFGEASKTKDATYTVKNINTAAAVKSENILTEETPDETTTTAPLAEEQTQTPAEPTATEPSAQVVADSFTKTTTVYFFGKEVSRKTKTKAKKPRHYRAEARAEKKQARREERAKTKK